LQQSISFTEGPVARVLYIMSMPMVWGLLATMSFSAVDTYFVSRLGDDSLAAMGFIFPVVMVVTSLAIGLGAGVSSVIARTLGAGDGERAKQLAGDALVLSLGLSLLVMLLGLLSMDSLFLLLGAPASLLPQLNEYMTVWYYNTAFVLVFMVMSSLMRATGNTKVAGYLMLVSALLNALLDPLLIFGWGPIPAMGIAGAAWATLLTRGGMLLGCCFWVFGSMRLVSMPNTRWANIWVSWRKILHIGLPAMGTNMIIPLASAVTVALVAVHGSDAVAGFGVAMRVEPITLIVFYALSSVAGPFFGQNNNPLFHHRQRDAMSVLLKFCLAFGLAMALLLALVGETVVGWFSDKPSVQVVALAYLYTVPISYGLYGLVMSINASFNGLGKPMPPMVISAMRVLVLYLPLALVMQYFFDLQGLFVATTIINVVMGIWGYVWLKRTLARQHAQ